MTPDRETTQRDLHGSTWYSAPLALIAVILCMIVAHLSFLRVPYFWDETYFARVAHDFFLMGTLTPTSVPPESHPPLVYMWIAACWKVFGFSISVARISMLAVAALTLIAVYQLARLVTTGATPIVVTALTGIYSVFFTESTLVQLDMTAAGLTLFGLVAHLRRRHWTSGILFSFAVLAKETAIVTPFVIAVLELVLAFRASQNKIGETVRSAWKPVVPMLLPLVALLCWFGWLYHVSGSAFGDPDYVKYNVKDARSPVHIALAAAQHLWHLFAYLNLFVLTGLAAILCVARRRLQASSESSQNGRTWLTLGAVTAGYVAMLSVVGGVMLARYLLPVYPIVILACVAAIRSRVKWWPAAAGLIAVAFVAGLFPYTNRFLFRRDDNLAYLDYVALHLAAAEHFANGQNLKVATVWPGSYELSEPWLGYVRHQVEIKEVDSYGPEDLEAIRRSQAQYVLMFPRRVCKVENPLFQRHLLHGNDFHGGEDVTPEQVAGQLGARVIYSERRHCDWVAVLKVGEPDPAAH